MSTDTWKDVLRVWESDTSTSVCWATQGSSRDYVVCLRINPSRSSHTCSFRIKIRNIWHFWCPVRCVNEANTVHSIHTLMPYSCPMSAAVGPQLSFIPPFTWRPPLHLSMSCPVIINDHVHLWCCTILIQPLQCQLNPSHMAPEL